MTIRLNKVTRDLNVGIATVVDFLQRKGYSVEASPNAKITDEQYAELVKEFSKDKDLKIESEKIIQERQNKERNKASVSIEDIHPDRKKKTEMIETTVPEEVRPKLKPVGKIDLDRMGRKQAGTAGQTEAAGMASLQEYAQKGTDAAREALNKQIEGIKKSAANAVRKAAENTKLQIYDDDKIAKVKAMFDHYFDLEKFRRIYKI